MENCGCGSECGCTDNFGNDFDMSGLAIQVGMDAPLLDLEGYFKGVKKRYTFEDFMGKWIVLFFYPLDFTFVCPTELLELSKRHSELEKINAQALGISIDSVYSHEAWSKDLGDLNFPLLSDITKEVAALYNVLLDDQGIALRATFIISPDRVIKSMTVNDLDVGRNVDEVIRVISALQTGELCPANWKPGDKTLGKS